MLYQVRGDCYEWAPCRVVGWNEAARAFEVEFDGAAPAGTGIDDVGVPLSGGLKGKLVKRLNLRFKVSMSPCEGPRWRGCADGVGLWAR